jgi:hypothetical protein
MPPLLKDDYWRRLPPQYDMRKDNQLGITTGKDFELTAAGGLNTGEPIEYG